MEKYFAYLDEHGTAASHSERYFVLTAILTNFKNSKNLKSNFNTLKVKYFGRRSYYFHRTDLISHLKGRGQNLDMFLAEFKHALNSYFFVLQVIVDNEKCLKKGWGAEYI